MSMLVLADSHLGYSGYSTYNAEGVSTATEYIRQALDDVYIRSQQPDINIIICAGDFFHSKHPTTENVRWAISWFKKMNSIGKPFYIITGNHDVGSMSHSLVFMRELDNCPNIHLIEDFQKIKHSGFEILFIPFVPNVITTKNKYQSTLELIKEQVANIDWDNKCIVVSHIQESTATVGSEALMVSNKCETINLSEVLFGMNITFLFGHMHHHQIYTKSGSTVCYPG